MPLRFSRRVSLIAGLRVNLSKSGASLSIGHRGAWYTSGRMVGASRSAFRERAPHAGHRAAFAPAIVLVLIALAAIVGHPDGYQKAGSYRMPAARSAGRSRPAGILSWVQRVKPVRES
jgi:hypothetical protein